MRDRLLSMLFYKGKVKGEELVLLEFGYLRALNECELQDTF